MDQTVANALSLDQLFANHNPVALDLLKKMLIISPERRITVAEALTHPFFAEFHDPEDEPVADPLLPYDFDFELYDLTTEQLMDLMYDEIQLYHDETLLDAYIEDRMLNPEGKVAQKFGLQKLN